MATDWVEMVHDATGGSGLVPNKESVIAARREKGWHLASEKPESADPVVTDDDGDSKSTRKARSRAADNEE